jgi:hypothetical protein
VIDAEDRSGEIWTRADLFPRSEHECLVWRPNGAAEPFELLLDELLRPI